MKSHFTKLVLGLILFALGQNLVQAQKVKSLNGVLSLRLQNTGAIIEKGIVKGYYFFYKEDKIDKKTYKYRLQILDENLNQIGFEAIEASKNLDLLEGAYNGESILLKFINYKDKVYTYYSFDKKGKITKEKTVTASKYDLRMISYNRSNGIENISLFEIPNQGFVSYSTVKEKRYGYKIQFIPEGDLQPWELGTEAKNDEIEFPTFLASGENILLSTIIKKKSILSNKYDSYVQAIDIQNGKVLFETQMTNSQYDIHIMNASLEGNNQEILLFGMYFKQGDNASKDPSLGFCTMKLDRSGKVLETNLISWAKDVAKYLPVNEKGKFEEGGYVFFHDIVKLKDGSIYLIGEQYRKTVSGAGVAVNMLGGRASNFQLTVTDMIIFKLNPESQLEDISIFHKSKSRAQLPAGAGINGPQLLAMYMKQFGAFDYSFTQRYEDRSKFTVGFVDWDKEQKGRNKLVFGAITRIDGDYSLDKIDLSTESSSLRVRPAKPGYILLSEYYSKDKRLDLRLEQINY